MIQKTETQERNVLGEPLDVERADARAIMRTDGWQLFNGHTGPLALALEPLDIAL